VEDFFKGKLVTMYIGSSAAGGTDIYGRIVASYIGAHIPGKPQVIASNVPGANGLILANRLYNALPRDGTALATFDRYLAIQAIVGNPSAKFDPAKFNWIGSTNIDVSTCATWHTSGVATLADFLGKDIAVGSTSHYHPNILNKVFGAHIKLITGYPGGNEIDIALERGEVAARCHWSYSSVWTSHADWVREKKINIVLQFSRRKHPELPNVPLVTELIKTEAERELVDLVVAPSEAARPFAAPPEVPPERVEALRKAFIETLADPALLEAAQKQALEIQPVPGGDIQELIERIGRTPPEVVARLRDIMEIR
jgi:tripartite-type tricarboxylate transporter receptor subunit TctC